MDQVKFHTTKEDFGIANKIARRAVGVFAQAGLSRTILDCHMDIMATHANGNPLRLADLFAADDVNFSHDVVGIYRHLDRETGKLGDFFSPRYSKRQSEAA